MSSVTLPFPWDAHEGSWSTIAEIQNKQVDWTQLLERGSPKYGSQSGISHLGRIVLCNLNSDSPVSYRTGLEWKGSFEWFHPEQVSQMPLNFLEGKRFKMVHVGLTVLRGAVYYQLPRDGLLPIPPLSISKSRWLFYCNLLSLFYWFISLPSRKSSGVL